MNGKIYSMKEILRRLTFITIFLSLISCVAESDIEVLQFDDDESVVDTIEEVVEETPPGSPPESSVAATSKTLITAGLTPTTCLINSTGALYCTGDNHDSDDNVPGLLGINNGTNTTVNSLQLVDAGTSYKSVSAGEFVVCGITNTDSVKCWGSGFSSGTPSDASSDHKLVPTDIEDSSGDSYLYVDTGSYHACAITTANVLKCWGNNWDGTLGRASNSRNVEVSDSGTLYTHVSGGRNHTCGVTVDKKMRCFGNNNQGQIGNGVVDNAAYPAQIIDATTDYQYISATENGNCAITTNNKLKCWGADTYGRTGNGATTGNVTNPELIDGSEDYKLVDTGREHTCAITTSNKLKCWGRNHVGQLGTGSVTAQEDLPLVIDGANDYKEVTVGGAWGTNYTCALRLNGDLRCWGDNGAGQLGLGDNTDRTAGPVDVQLGFN
jgi:alpha-tubulin suppressor-like RCC1 family protein